MCADSAAADNSAAIEHVMTLADAAEDGLVTHDLSDPLHAAYLQHVMGLAGKTRERQPGLFERITHQPDGAPAGSAEAATPAIRSALPPGDEFVDGQLVAYVGKLENTGATSSAGLFTRTSPIAHATVTIAAYNDAVGPSPLAIGSSDLWNGIQTVKPVTDDNTAQAFPAQDGTYSVLTWSVEYADGTFENASQKTIWAQNAAKDPLVNHPRQRTDRNTGDLTAIVIGLSRNTGTGGLPAADIDYGFWQNQSDNNTLLVPLDGSMSFNYPITAPLGPTNPMLKFWLALKAGGMNEMAASQASQYLPQFSIDPSDPTGKTIKFSCMPTSTDAGTSINFGKSWWDSDKRTYFTGKVTVALNGPLPGTLGWSTIMSTDTADTDQTDGVAQIKPIVYVWHCLVAGTQIQLADGTTKAVEDFQSGDVVQSADGVTRPVLATLAQPHYGPVYTVTAASGATVTCSGTHPVITTAGPAQAQSLTAGTSIYTSSGETTVTSVTTSQQAGEGLFNVWLDPATPGATTIIANGFWLGDYQMQVALLDALENDPERLRAATPAHLMTDLESYLETLVTA
jgi:hypothetical protein